MSFVVTIAGSPSAPSRSAAVLDYARQRLLERGVESHAIVVRDLDARDLVHGRYDSPALQPSINLIAGATGVIVATPVYKAAYSGVLKAFLDLLPQNALADKSVLPLATGGSPAHMLALEYALKPVLAALGAQHILNGVYILDTQLHMDNGSPPHFEAALATRLEQALDHLGALVLASAPQPRHEGDF